MYKTISDLPNDIKKLSVDKQKKWLATFNSVFKKYNGDEKKSFAIANGTIKETIIDLAEQAPEGSFEDMREDLNAAFMAQYTILFPGVQNYDCYVMYCFPDYVIASCKSDFYKIAYSNSNGEIKFDKPVEVEQYFAPAVVQEGNKNKTLSLEDELKETGIKISKKAEQVDCSYDIMLNESSFNEATGEVEAVLIEAGTNPLKKRHYPDSTIREAADKFAGLKMYINHQTPAEEAARPERDLRDWASTIVESRYESGKAIGKIVVHDQWLRERLKDPTARAHIGLSINASGNISMGKINGEDMQIVEKIVLNRKNGSASVDWVTEAGARGRVSRLLKESTKKEENNMKELKEATMEDIQRENPELLKKIQESSLNESKELKEARAENAKLKKDAAVREQKEKINALLKEAKTLPEIAKNRITVSLQETLFENEAKLKEAVDGAIKSELEYINSISGKGKIQLGENGNAGNLRESFEGDLTSRMGIKKEEVKEKQ